MPDRLVPDDSTPYAGTSGFRGSATSRDRALADDARGDTHRRDAEVLRAVRHAGPRGLTYREAGAALDLLHEKVSGSLSRLHMAGHVTRLADKAERRVNCAPYVTPEHVNGRDVAPHGRRRPTLELAEQAAVQSLKDAVGDYGDDAATVLVHTDDVRLVLAALGRLA